MNTLELLKNEAARTFTENGAVTLSTTHSDCLDLFALGGALRNADDQRVKKLFSDAYAENADLALKILFYLRDVRGGLGERKVFRTMLKTLAQNHPESVVKNLCYIAEYGRYDDLLCLLETPLRDKIIGEIKTQLEKDTLQLAQGPEGGAGSPSAGAGQHGEISLLAKWLPSINASDKSVVKTANMIAKSLGMNAASYRKMLSALRTKIKIIENNLRTKDYSFDYEKQTSKSLFKYRKAFVRNDGERYKEFMGKVEKGEAILKTGTLYPYDVIAPCFAHGRWGGIKADFSAEDRRTMDATWNSLENFADGKNALVVCDTSGSMFGGGTPLPIAVSVSLALYFAEHNTGTFKNHFITFSEKPELVEVKGKDIVDKVQYVSSADWGGSTNIEGVFDLVLRTAVKKGLPQEDLPESLYIISDMEFNQCAENADLTNFENAKKKFEEAGYKLPNLVFWNVQSRRNNLPVSKNEQGAVLVSGASPRIFAMIKEDELNPYDFMLSVVNSERYEKIVA